MTYGLAKITGATIVNNKTGNEMIHNVEHWESTSTGKMKYTGLGLMGKATWLASSCTVIKHADYNVDVRIK